MSPTVQALAYYLSFLICSFFKSIQSQAVSDVSQQNALVAKEAIFCDFASNLQGMDPC